MTFRPGDAVQYRKELREGNPEIYPPGVKIIDRVEDTWKVFSVDESGFDTVDDLELIKKHYPYIDGPHLVIGLECFTGDGNEVSQDTISWRGENYYRSYAADAAVSDKNGTAPYDDWQTRQMLVQIMPNASLRQLEERRAWIAGEVSLTQQVRDTIWKFRNVQFDSPQMHNAIEELIALVGSREEQ